MIIVIVLTEVMNLEHRHAQTQDFIVKTMVVKEISFQALE